MTQVVCPLLFLPAVLQSHIFSYISRDDKICRLSVAILHTAELIAAFTQRSAFTPLTIRITPDIGIAHSFPFPFTTNIILAGADHFDAPQLLQTLAKTSPDVTTLALAGSADGHALSQYDNNIIRNTAQVFTRLASIVWCGYITDGVMAALAAAASSRLTALDLADAIFEGASLHNHIRQFTELTTLALPSVYQNVDADVLTADDDGSAAETAVYCELASIGRLSVLTCGYTLTATNISALATLTSLTAIDMSTVSLLTAASLSALTGRQHIRVVALPKLFADQSRYREALLGTHTFMSIASISNLTFLSFSSPHCHDILPLNQLTSLQLLRLADVSVTAQMIQDCIGFDMSCFTNLSVLDLSESVITDDTVLLISERTTQLRCLLLDECPLVTAIAFIYVAHMSHLRALSMNGCNSLILTDKSLAAAEILAGEQIDTQSPTFSQVHYVSIIVNERAALDRNGFTRICDMIPPRHLLYIIVQHSIRRLSEVGECLEIWHSNVAVALSRFPAVDTLLFGSALLLWVRRHAIRVVARSTDDISSQTRSARALFRSACSARYDSGEFSSLHEWLTTRSIDRSVREVQQATWKIIRRDDAIQRFAANAWSDDAVMVSADDDVDRGRGHNVL